MSQYTGEVEREQAAGIIKPLLNNFVERPWGGTRIRDLKGLCSLPDQVTIGGAGIGESFEIAACDDDDEARCHPSRVTLADGAVVSLPGLIRAQGDALLGTAWTRAHGRCIPLLPKFLDVRELLSVQGHPPGHTEVYVIVDADPGATIRLGFNRDMDRAVLRRTLRAGRAAQLALLGSLRGDVSQPALHRVLAPWFADREAPVGSVLNELRAFLPSATESEAARLLSELKTHYWFVLDAMNEIPVSAGQVIHNANPARIVARSRRKPAAEVHALGNPAGKEIVALEIRRPGPTLRAWDHVRFPLRDIDIDAALDVLSLDATEPSELIVEPRPLPGRPHAAVSVESEYFRLEHLSPPITASVDVSDRATHCLHNLSARVEIDGADGRALGHLERGESAIVPESIGSYRLTAAGADAHVVKVDVP